MRTGNKKVADVLSMAAAVKSVWQDNPGFTLGTDTPETLQTAMETVVEAQLRVQNARTDLTGLVDARDDKVKELTDLITRARSGMRAVFGPDSAQYDQVGCIRRSERKAARRNGATGQNGENGSSS